MHRRHFLHGVLGTAAWAMVPGLPRRALAAVAPIDRRARTARHDPRARRVDEWAPLSVGNGGFAFTADVTGLQAFPEAYREIPLATQAEWGWDYPLVAMTAARLGEPERAVDALLMETPKNRYLLSGHNYQHPGLTIYLPGNGALLSAVAMMAEGWDGGLKDAAPGFPREGWEVRSEGLLPFP